MKRYARRKKHGGEKEARAKRDELSLSYRPHRGLIL